MQASSKFTTSRNITTTRQPCGYPMSPRAEAAKSVELFVASQEAPDTYTHEPIGYAPIPTHPRDAAHPRPFISLAFGLSESAPLIPHYSKHQLDRAVIEGPGRPELTSLWPQQPKAFEQAPVATESGVTGKRKASYWEVWIRDERVVRRYAWSDGCRFRPCSCGSQ